MAGIKSYGAYIPWHRIDRNVIYSAMGWLDPTTYTLGEKSVANYDEDAVTMAVAACINCLNGIDRSVIDGVYFSSLSLPYKQRLNASIIATALDLRTDIRTADFSASTKAGTTALLAACEAIKAGTARNILVCTADCLIGKPGSPQEEEYGDGAAAFLIGKGNVIASFQNFYSVSYDFMDAWMINTDKYNRLGESRWIREEGYSKFIPEAISGLMNKCHLAPQDIAKASYPCIFPKPHINIGKIIGFSPEQIQDHYFGTFGNTGTAYPLILLVASLENAKPNDKIIVASFGSGSDALAFQVTDEITNISINNKNINNFIANKEMLTNYNKFVTFRNTITVEKGIRGETVPWQQTAMAWRNRKELLGLIGTKCKECGTPQYPRQRVCVNPNCRAIDQMEDYRFSDKKGYLFTYTADSLVFTVNPPQIYGLVNFEGGGRYWYDLTDCKADDIKVNMPVEMTFRKKFTDANRSIYGYCWKAIPVRT
ncbi:MAG: OB-fold domain-containing protein [Dehalococcoidales bacterium]|nr:OB-fold domain-containing protein [Dehalococcoidales bacterium]